jgi:uncharacterized protein
MVDAHGRFVWYELVTTDVENAKAFYAEVVGWTAHDAAMPDLAYSLFNIAGAPVSGLMSLPKEAQAAGVMPHWVGYIAADDVDATVELIGQLGGAILHPPMDVPGISRFAIVSDPQRASFALIKGVKPGRRQPADPGTTGIVGWHELLAANWEQAFVFYGKLFGWQKAGSHFGAMGSYQQFSAGGDTLGGMFTKSPTLPYPFWLYYFSIIDIERAARRVEAGGGEILYGPTEVPGGAWIVQCTDPQGAIFGLLDRRPRKAVGYFVPPDTFNAGAPHS